MGKLSIVLPARNEPYLQKTIKSMLERAKGDIEIIAILDGYWPDASEIVVDDRVNYIHFTEPKGMRAGINAGVTIARGEYILKCDSHIVLGEGFDEILKKDCYDQWIVVPRRYALDVKKWQIEERTDNKYPLDYMYLSKDLHGEIWKERDIARKDIMIDDLMSSQGSCWMMKKSWFEYLELMDEKTYGIFWSEFQEIGLKGWLAGGRIMVNKNTWYAHWHKVGSRGYQLPTGDKEQTQSMVNRWKTEKMFSKQKHDLNWLIRKFAPVPTWD